MIVNLLFIFFTAVFLRLEKKSINVFGLLPIQKRMLQLLVGFSLTALLLTFINLLFATVANFSWKPVDHYSFSQVTSIIYDTFNSVIYEELIFRGYVLYKLFQWFGEKKAVLITSALFGMYHWFSFGILGNYPSMIFVFFFTGLWGVMFAYAYTRTGTLLFTIGLHWGWNFFDQAVFNRNGNGWLKFVTTSDTTILNQQNSFLVTMLPAIIFSMLMILYLVRYRKVEVVEQ